VLKRFSRILDRPKVLIADTVKGAGVSFMQHTSMTSADRFYRFHSGAPDDDSYARAVAELVQEANTQLSKVRAGPLKTSSLIARKLGAARKIIVASPEYLERHSIPRSAEELRNHRRIGFSYVRAMRL
jgi:hypothetical protein